MVQVDVKWGKEKFSVKLDPGAGAAGLHAQLLTLTGVPTLRQKIMGGKKAFKGVLKTDKVLLSVQEGATLVLIGSAEVLAEPPTGDLAGLGLIDFDVELEKAALEAVHEVHSGTALEECEGLINAIQKPPLQRAECDRQRTEPYAYSRLAHGYPQSKVKLPWCFSHHFYHRKYGLLLLCAIL
jgi:hypothetical protein